MRAPGPAVAAAGSQFVEIRLCGLARWRGPRAGMAASWEVRFYSAMELRSEGMGRQAGSWSGMREWGPPCARRCARVCSLNSILIDSHTTQHCLRRSGTAARVSFLSTPWGLIDFQAGIAASPKLSSRRASIHHGAQGGAACTPVCVSHLVAPAHLTGHPDVDWCPLCRSNWCWTSQTLLQRRRLS